MEVVLMRIEIEVDEYTVHRLSPWFFKEHVYAWIKWQREQKWLKARRKK
jgi:hypothetical protein